MAQRSRADVVAEFDGIVTIGNGAAGEISLYVSGVGFPSMDDRVVGPRVHPVDPMDPMADGVTPLHQVTFVRISRDGRPGFLEARLMAGSAFLFSSHNWQTEDEAREVASWSAALALSEWPSMVRRDA